MGQRDTDRQGRPGSLGICMLLHREYGIAQDGCLILGVPLTCTMPEEREASRDPMRARRKEGRKGRVKGSSQGGGNAQPKWENLYESLKREERAMAKQDCYLSRRARVRTKGKEGIE